MTHAANRRLVIAALAALGMPWFSLAHAQKPKIWRIGFLTLVSREAFSDSGRMTAFLEGMHEHGYTVGKDFNLEARFADGKSDRLIELAKDLVRRKVDLIVTAGADAGRAAQRATTTIPIVLGSAADPVGAGLVASLSRPGGNITGLSLISTDLGPKHLELLKGVSPKLTRACILLNPNNSGHPALLQSVLTAAQKVGVTIVPVDVRTPADLEQAFVTMDEERVEAVIVSIDIFFLSNRRQIADLATRHKKLSIFGYREPVEAGGLIGYGQDLNQIYRHAAVFVDKVLRGVKPSDIPVEQPTTLYLTINLKTAKTLGLTIPRDLLLRADKIIE